MTLRICADFKSLAKAPVIRASIGGPPASRNKVRMMIVTHDMREAFALANRIGVLDAGRLIAYDRPQALSGSTDARVRELLAGASLLAGPAGGSIPASAS